MPAVAKDMNKKGDFLVDYEEKVFPDVKAEPGEKALVTFHTVAFEGSISIVNTLVATRLLRKGYETSILLYGPGVTMGFQRGFPTLGDEAFPGHLFVNQRMEKFMEEGGKVYGCRFSTQALYGQTEKAFIPGIRPINPLDVLDIIKTAGTEQIHQQVGAGIAQPVALDEKVLPVFMGHLRGIMSILFVRYMRSNTTIFLLGGA